MKACKIIITAIVIIGIFFSGCISNSTNKPTEPQTPVVSPTPVSSQNTQSMEQTKINELENKINSMQQQINDLQTRIIRVDLLKPSEKELIPQLPFKVEIYDAEWQTPLTYIFKENGMAELGNGNDIEYATYKLFRNNNTIKLNSPKYKFYGLVFYDDYAASIYENGWIGWVYKYKLFPPKYNPETQKYELS
ncbi:MAG: hypothetical protein O8C67_09030 [Candidatus Methanoperedens sp.]|nr:hypothetical protein [Candidatus Methanoperedens sp.]MCZ7405059.1 hypothetical protein [Candidatus Methanoperedens sp.]